MHGNGCSHEGDIQWQQYQCVGHCVRGRSRLTLQAYVRELEILVPVVIRYGRDLDNLTHRTRLKGSVWLRITAFHMGIQAL